ncbi:MAG: transcriptional repressor [Anaerolineae bacterium]|nr:transcriptional repressor [Anaerolineae bacterium]
MTDDYVEIARQGRLASALHTAGYKLTGPRLAVLYVLEMELCHASPQEVYERGVAIYPALGLSTVYRTLDILTELGLARPAYLGDASQRFTVHHDQRHYHLVCDACGAITDVDEDRITELACSLAAGLGFKPRGQYLEIYGLCQHCQAQPARPPVN